MALPLKEELGFDYRHVNVLSIIVSSPEHEVLMVSYCDQSLSVVRRVSCVVNNLF